MGNNQDKENAQFGKNFNFAQHNRKMAQISHNYAEHNLQVQRGGPARSNAPKDQSFQQLQRKNAIYKPSININVTQTQANISFQYNSEQGCEVLVYLGVNNINQDSAMKHTTQIEADYKFNQTVAAGTKVPFKRTYPINNKNVMNKQIILRIQQDQQATQISLRKVKQSQEHWKIILQKFQIGQRTFQLQNIYGGGDGGQQCIVCMSEPSNTIVKPCNHLCLCKQCAKTVSSRTNKCPICRKNIQDLVTINSSQ